MPTNEYYDSTGVPASRAALSSATMRAVFDKIEDGFCLLPELSGNGSLPVFVNAAGTEMEAVSAAAAKTALGLGNVDNTSDATKNSAVATLTNKTFVAPALGTPASGNLANCVFTWASSIIRGIVELATIAEVNTGSDADRAVTPDALAGSVFGTKTYSLKCIPDDTTLTTGDGKGRWVVPEECAGMNIVSVGVHVFTVSHLSGVPTFSVYNEVKSHDVLSTPLTIDLDEHDSSSAGFPAVIDTSYDDVTVGTAIRFDCDTAGTGTKGMDVRISLRRP